MKFMISTCNMESYLTLLINNDIGNIHFNKFIYMLVLTLKSYRNILICKSKALNILYGMVC